jgi:hypothetical protein
MGPAALQPASKASRISAQKQAAAAALAAAAAAPPPADAAAEQQLYRDGYSLRSPASPAPPTAPTTPATAAVLGPRGERYRAAVAKPAHVSAEHMCQQGPAASLRS